MRTEKDVEAYLSQMKRSFSKVAERSGENGTTFVISMGAHTAVQCAMRVEAPLVVARANLGRLGEGQNELMKILLTHNAKMLVHTSFGLEEDSVVLTSAHQLENLDYNELEATLDEMDVTLGGELPKLQAYFKKDS